MGSHQILLGFYVGKTEHHATAVNQDGNVVHDRPLPQSEPKMQELLKDLGAKHGELLVVVDQPKTIGALVVAVAQHMNIQVAYLPGLTMRRVADLHPGQAKTDARDAYIIAEQHARCLMPCVVSPWQKNRSPSCRWYVVLTMI